METLRFSFEILAAVANVLTIATAGLALYLYATKRQELSAAVRVLVNFSFQTSLIELKGKLDRLNEYNASIPEDVDEIRNILHEIAGQLRGNKKLSAADATFPDRVEKLAAAKILTEGKKRSLTYELREFLKNIDVENFEELMEQKS